MTDSVNGISSSFMGKNRRQCVNSWGCNLERRSILMVVLDCCINLSHSCSGKTRSFFLNLYKIWFFYVWVAISMLLVNFCLIRASWNFFNLVDWLFEWIGHLISHDLEFKLESLFHEEVCSISEVSDHWCTLVDIHWFRYDDINIIVI